MKPAQPAESASAPEGGSCSSRYASAASAASSSAVGAVLLEGFRALYDKYAAPPLCVGSVRGVGLMVGLEMLRTPRSGDERPPWTEAAGAVVHAMRLRRVLLSTDGMASNVIKLKPPMVFDEADAAHVLRELAEVLDKLDEAIEVYRKAAPAELKG